ncbi:MAG: YIP1 family protein [Pirellulaceae bacterium]|nr:YIP1 family protein [Pirellulaceae bacterium]
MPIEFRCQQCDQMLRVPDDSAGKNARCPKCQSLMTVPSPASSGSPPATPAAPGAPETGGSQPAGHPVVSPPGPAADSPAFVPAPFAPKPANPFSDGGAASPFAPGSKPPFAFSDNPYAAPGGGFGSAYSSFAPTNRLRTGLPWEIGPRSLGVWWKTAGMVMSSPSEAFSRMRQEGSLEEPIHFNIYGLGQLLLVALLLGGALGLLILAMEPGGNIGEKAVGAVVVALAAMGLGAIYVLLVATLGMMFSAAIYHVCLLIVGGARRGYETTFRVTSYGTLSLMWLFAIPYIGGLIAGIWLLVILIIGLAKAHEISTGKAALAVLLPYIVCCGGYALLIFLAIALDAAR